MWGRRSAFARRLLGPGAAAVLLLGLAPPASAVEPIVGTPIPDEDVHTLSDLPVTDAITYDLDGDGVRELVAVIGREDGQGLAAIQAWWVNADGVEAETNAVPLRRAASVDELLSGRGRLGIDRDDMIAVRMNEPAKLFSVTRDGTPVLLVAAIGTDNEFEIPCCYTVWEVVVSGTTLDLRLVASTSRQGSEAVSADLDADGTDELVINEGATSGASTSRAGILRWDGQRFTRTGLTILPADMCCASIVDVGDTDGLPGEEVLLVVPDEDGGNALLRVSMRAGAPYLERVSLGNTPFGPGVASARIVPLRGADAIVTSDGFLTLYQWSWPADEKPEQIGLRTGGGAVLAVLGTGSQTRLVIAGGVPPGSVSILGADIANSPLIALGRDTRPGAFGGTAAFTDASPPPVEPFYGLVPGGLPDAPDAFVFAGQLVRAVADPDVMAEAQAIALLPGVEPIGIVGPADAWMGLVDNFDVFAPYQPNGSQSPKVATTTNGGRLGTLRLAPTNSVLQPERRAGDLEPTFHGVAPDPERPGVMIVGNDAVTADVVGPRGTQVWWTSHGIESSTEIGTDGQAHLLLVAAAGPEAPDGSGATVSVWAITPGGHAYSGIWRIRVFRKPPTLALQDGDELVNFSPTVTGQTDPGVSVTVNGIAADVRPDGSFEAPVEVGITPADVRVVATDPVGNQSEKVVSLVWPIDYRRLPFIPIAVLLTVVAGLLLFLRKPESGPSRRSPEDGASFEEIG